MDKSKVLIVDDSKINLSILAQMLGPLELDLLKAQSGPEALELVQEHDCALVLLDVYMPEMDGYEVAREMRKSEKTASVPIIFLTASNPEEKDLFAGYDAGAVDFLFKPVQPHVLQSKVRVFCDQDRQDRLVLEQLQEIEKQKDALEKEIQERNRIENALRESEVRYRALVELSPVSVGVQVNNRLVYFNTATMKLLGAAEREDIEGEALQNFAHPDNQRLLAGYIERMEKQGGRGEPLETRLLRLDGQEVDVEINAGCTIYEGNIGVQVAIQDITAHKALEKELRRLSHYDGLTGIANRRTFDECLEKEWRRAIRDKTRLSLIMVDIDSFKAFNDNYGHQAGDACLCRIAESMQQVVNRPGDMLARYGGEEFAVILPDTHTPGAAWIGEAMRKAVIEANIPHAFSKAAAHVTISIGVATMVPERESKPQKLIKHADSALYESKSNGRNRVTIQR